MDKNKLQEVMVLHVDIVSRIVEENLRTKVIELIPTTAKSGRICDGIGLVTECGKVFVKMLKNSQVSHSLFFLFANTNLKYFLSRSCIISVFVLFASSFSSD